MARKRSSKKGGKKFQKPQADWVDLAKENANWEKYYENMLFGGDKDEFAKFKKVCQEPLPITFRITGSRNHASEVLNLFKEKHLKFLNEVEYEGSKINPPIELPWYPNHFGWQLEVHKTVMRKNDNFAKTQRFLVVETDVGNISRQEAVSMLPPILLDVKPHHTVLDMCAAPGSKTAQLMESLHIDSDEPSGFVIANDADNKRSHLLVHQLKRLSTSNVLIVNHDAQFFPNLKINTKDASSQEDLKFDRILCDVPCSGDGTMRKNVNVWKNWNTQNALGLHNVQFNILDRGLTLLKETGKLVYSTCSLNPIENEAVVAAVLRKWGDKVRLVCCDDKLKGLIRSKGLTTWPVINRDMEEVPRNRSDDKINKSCYPPTEEEVSKFNLDRCMRVYPHQQNTGGFFITMFEKVVDNKETDKPKRETKKQCIEAVGSKNTPKKVLQKNEEPVMFLPSDHSVLKQCAKFYGIGDAFNMDSCLVRNTNGEPSKTIYYVSPSLKQVIQHNDHKLKIIYTGAKIFVCQRSDVECSWKIQSESLSYLKHHMKSDRILKSSMLLFKFLLGHPQTTMDEIKMSNVDPNFARAETLSSGCIFVDVSRDNSEKLILPLWKGIKSINLMVRKEDIQEMLYRYFDVETTLKEKVKEVESKNEDLSP
ncbi:hypothetical protein TPHA_0H00150 [Tetrapisispora phaffii CBS 4417]|uniref:SAM-dependent MTase RsmB/NOP-type domain-containing protein n=1 Tax=Tetrapisispora phaffii (strain ATCC 24235 / CBS 4417 / NBRC 1672 / NRRL Y-8282 / UCD 70-5) TaxID=1071381 RepID=G8BWS2_TETPH|nr:hypothetical protein TPHA_0H00150 [Tetrapisispora phaffii CBS 4417]CCE64226.1 hypothetical protein TPHA_0H00150 [Tetrapisispora phaffii CBS 4417]